MRTQGTAVHGRGKHENKIHVIEYTGNSTVNRAIAHNLGVKPTMVHIRIKATHVGCGSIMDDGYVHYGTAASDAAFAVTTHDENNFYVGNVVSYVESMNDTAVEYFAVVFS